MASRGRGGMPGGRGGGFRGGGRGGGFGRGGFPSPGPPATGPKPDPNKGMEPPPLYPPLARPPSPPPISSREELLMRKWRQYRQRTALSPYHIKRPAPKPDLERYSEVWAAQQRSTHSLIALIKTSWHAFPPELASSKPPRPGRPMDPSAVRRVNLEAFAALEKDEEGGDADDKPKGKGTEGAEEEKDVPEEEVEAAEEEDEEDNDYTMNYGDDDADYDEDRADDDGPSY